MPWTVETLIAVVDAELEALEHLFGPLWEMRMKGSDGISRALYVTAVRKRVVVVRVFIKKRKRRRIVKSIWR